MYSSRITCMLVVKPFPTQRVLLPPLPPPLSIFSSPLSDSQLTQSSETPPPPPPPPLTWPCLQHAGSGRLGGFAVGSAGRVSSSSRSPRRRYRVELLVGLLVAGSGALKARELEGRDDVGTAFCSVSHGGRQSASQARVSHSSVSLAAGLAGAWGHAAALGGGGGRGEVHRGRGGGREIDGGRSYFGGPVDLLADDGVQPRGEGTGRRYRRPGRWDLARGEHGLVAGVLPRSHNPQPFVRHRELRPPLSPSSQWTLQHGVGAARLSLLLLQHGLHGGGGRRLYDVVPDALHQGPFLRRDRHGLPLDVVVPQRRPGPRVVYMHPDHPVLVDLVVLNRSVSSVLDPNALHPVACYHVFGDERAAAGAGDVDTLSCVVADPVILDLCRRSQLHPNPAHPVLRQQVVCSTDA
eukprot:148738-Hanusia_phi.AAC.3